MKEVILIIIAILVSINLYATTAEYIDKAEELKSVERIEAISNGICNDQINEELNKLNDEQLTEVLGL